MFRTFSWMALFGIAALCAALLELPCSTRTLADEPAPKTPRNGASAQETSATCDWHKDSDCRLVFHAVLEGLYEDGVPTAIVERILGAQDRDEEHPMRCFVFRCKLCHAVYEAMALYRRRPAFNGGGGADTFGVFASDPAQAKLLANSDTGLGSLDMGKLIQPWIKRKLLASGSTPAKCARWFALRALGAAAVVRVA